MSQFSRRARWLNQFFTASKAPQTFDPASVSDDVSLVQEYDGGGIPIPESSSWIPPAITGTAGPSVTTTLVTVPPGFIYRCFSVQCVLAVVPQIQAMVRVQMPETGNSCAVSKEGLLVPGIGLGPFWVDFGGNPVIIPSEGLLLGFSIGGGAGSQLTWFTYGCLAPEGTVFRF